LEMDGKRVARVKIQLVRPLAADGTPPDPAAEALRPAKISKNPTGGA